MWYANMELLPKSSFSVCVCVCMQIVLLSSGPKVIFSTTEIFFVKST